MSDLSQKRIALEDDIRYFSSILSRYKKKELHRTWHQNSSYTSRDLSNHLELCSQIADILNVGTGDNSATSLMVSEPSHTVSGCSPQIRVFIVSEKSSHVQSPFPSQRAGPPSFTENPPVHMNAGNAGATFSTTAASSRSVEVILATAHEAVPVEQHISDVLAFVQQKATAGEVSTLVVRRCYRKIHKRLHAHESLFDNTQSPEDSGLIGLLKLWAETEKEDYITTFYVPEVERRQRYAGNELEKLAPNADPTAETVKPECTSKNIGDWAVALALRLQVAIRAFDLLVEGTPTLEDFDFAHFALATLEYFTRRHKGIWLTILRAPSFVTLASNWKYGGKDAGCADEDLPPGLSVSAGMLYRPTRMSYGVLQFLFNSITVFSSARTLRRLIKAQHDVQVRYAIPEQPTSPKEDVKPRLLNDLTQRFAPGEVIDDLPSEPIYFDGSIHPEAFTMVQANTSEFSDFPKAVGMTRNPCFCCHYLGKAMGYDLPDTHGIILPWSPPPNLPPQVLTDVWERLRVLYHDLLNSLVQTLSKSPESDFSELSD